MKAEAANCDAGSLSGAITESGPEFSGSPLYIGFLRALCQVDKSNMFHLKCPVTFFSSSVSSLPLAAVDFG